MAKAKVPDCSLVDYYDREVLPVLFRSLDRAFPEFGWKRANWGWTAKARRMPDHGTNDIRQGDATGGDIQETQRFYSQQPSGFIDLAGHLSSWLTYVNGGRTLKGTDLVQCIGVLAGLAGVDVSQFGQTLSEQEQERALQQTRQRDLLEASVVYAQGALRETWNGTLTKLLQRNGIHLQDAEAIPLGIYSTRRGVREHLRNLGFSDEEIRLSAIVGDSRLEGRLIIPWRDEYGLLRSLIAYDYGHVAPRCERYLFLHREHAPDMLGLGVDTSSLQQTQGRLLVVDTPLEVIALQSSGLRNVCCLMPGKAGLRPDFWRSLQKMDVRQVLVVSSGSHRNKKFVFEVIRSAARFSAPPYILVMQDGREVADAVSSIQPAGGSDALNSVLENGIHGYRFAAQYLLQHHNLLHHPPVPQNPAEPAVDSRFMGLLSDAVDFDRQVRDPRRSMDLQKFFWPEILQSLNMDWEDLETCIPTRVSPLQRKREEQHTWRDNQKLLNELEQFHTQRRFGEFEALLLQAAQKLLKHRSPPITKVNNGQQPKAPTPLSHKPKRKSKKRINAQSTAEHLVPSEAAQGSSANRDWDMKRYAVLPPTPGQIRALAYRLWERNGRPQGFGREFWCQAERITDARWKAAIRQQNRSRPPQ